MSENEKDHQSETAGGARVPRIGYVLKKYPRYSETFIVNEILAHEAAGVAIEIVSLSPCSEPHFQDVIARVRAPVTYLPPDAGRASEFWDKLRYGLDGIPLGWAALDAARENQVRDVYHALLLARYARERGITHFHAHFATTATTVARLAAHFAGVPYSFTAHAKDIFHQSIDPADLRRKLIGAAAVVTVSNFNQNYLLESFGAAAAGVIRVYNGLDLDRLPFDPPRDRPPLILGVGRLVEKKGFDVLVDACSILAARGREFECQLVGAGEMEADLRARICAKRLQKQVRLVGPRPQGEVFQLLRRAAVFAAPCVIGADSNRDGLPTVLLEAMALGTPCVSTDVTGIPEILHHEQTGLLAPQHDAAALADACERLIGDAELRVRLATQARGLIEREFDIHRNTAHLRAIFRGDGPAVQATAAIATPAPATTDFPTALEPQGVG